MSGFRWYPKKGAQEDETWIVLGVKRIGNWQDFTLLDSRTIKATEENGIMVPVFPDELRGSFDYAIVIPEKEALKRKWFQKYQEETK